MGIMSIAVSAVAGTLFGMVLAGLVVNGKREDMVIVCCEKAEARKPVALLEEKRRIQFVDTEGNPTFAVSDGGSIEKMTSDGDSVASLCYYLDAEHARIDGVEWQMQEFACRMQKQGVSVSPIYT
jgi:hypothetical protein